MPDESLKSQLNGVCKSLSFSKKVCSKLVDAHFTNVRNLVLTKLNQKLCEDITACPDKNTTLSYDQNVSGFFCDGCEKLFNILR